MASKTAVPWANMEPVERIRARWCSGPCISRQGISTQTEVSLVCEAIAVLVIHSPLQHTSSTGDKGDGIVFGLMHGV